MQEKRCQWKLIKLLWCCTWKWRPYTWIFFLSISGCNHADSQSSVASPESVVMSERCRDPRNSGFSTTVNFKAFWPISCGLWVEKMYSILWISLWAKVLLPAGRLIRDYAAELFFPVIPDLLPRLISRACCRPPGFHLIYFWLGYLCCICNIGTEIKTMRFKETFSHFVTLIDPRSWFLAPLPEKSVLVQVQTERNLAFLFVCLSTWNQGTKDVGSSTLLSIKKDVFGYVS